MIFAARSYGTDEIVSDTLALGAHVEYAGAAFFRLAEGLIEEAWVVGDTREPWRALGVLP